MVKIASRESEAKRVGNEAVSQAAEAADTASRMMEDLLTNSRAVFGGGAEASQELMRLWAELGRDQLRHNLDAFGKLARATSWQEALEVQSGYLSETASRLSAAMSRQMELCGKLLTAKAAG